MKDHILEPSERFAFLGRILNPFSRKGFLDLSRSMPKTYYGLCILLASSVYLFFLSLPFLLVSLPVSIYHGVQSVNRMEDWIIPMVEITVLILCGMTVYSLSRISFTVPGGLEIKREKFPQLYAVLDHLQDHYQSRFLRIDRVVLSDKFEISLVQTPKSPLPIAFTRTLVIGVPVIQTMKPGFLYALLARRIGQASLQHNMLTGWLTGLSSVWKQYIRASRKAGVVAYPLYWFFKAYSALYHGFMLGAFRADELHADLYALELVNDEDVLEVISYELVVREYLKRKYWPNIIKMTRRVEKPDILPYTHMGKVVRKAVTAEVYTETLELLMDEHENHGTHFPSLYDRVENLGHHKPSMPPVPFAESAAERYFGARLDAILAKLDNRWLMKFNTSRQIGVTR